MLKINPGQPTVWLRPDTLQIGLEADAVVVGGLSPAHQRFIRALQSGIADNQLNEVARHTRVGVGEARSLLERLEPALLQNQRQPIADVTPAGAVGTIGTSRTASLLALLHQEHPDFAELIRLALATNRDGSRTLAHRSAAVVHIDRLDRTGITLMRGLATAGIAQFWSGDEGLVSRADTQGLGYPMAAVGKPRFEAAVAVANEFANRVALLQTRPLRARVLDRVGCAILIGEQAIAPERYARWLRRGTPHLAIRFDHTGVEISPVVVPNKTACLSCREREQQIRDPLRIVRVSQLTGVEGKYDDASSTLFAAAMTVSAVTDVVDTLNGFEPQVFERTGYRLERKTGVVSRIDWPISAGCACARSSAEEPAEPPALEQRRKEA